MLCTLHRFTDCRVPRPTATAQHDKPSLPPRAGEAKGPFIFTPFAARREPAAPEGPVQWVAGEAATVEVDISNPTTIPIKVGRRLWPLLAA
jgi:hypothetical protein